MLGMVQVWTGADGLAFGMPVAPLCVRPPLSRPWEGEERGTVGELSRSAGEAARIR